MKLIPKNKYHIQYAKSGVALDIDSNRSNIEQYNKQHLKKGHQYYNASIDSIIAMQKYLKARGFYNGNIDGQWGPMTEKAFQQASKEDKLLKSFKTLFSSLGLSKQKTQKALLRLPEKPLNKSGNLTKECAAYVNKVLEDNGIESWGDAFAINKQFKEIYNGYSGLEPQNIDNLSNAARIDYVLGMHHRAARNVAANLDVDALDKTHVYTVNMYFGQNRKDASPYLLDFYNKGIDTKTPGSHEGLLYYDPNIGWAVNHSIHGKIINEPLDNVLGDSNLYGIIGIADAGKIRDKSLPEIRKEEEERKAQKEARLKKLWHENRPFIGSRGGKLIPRAYWGLTITPAITPYVTHVQNTTVALNNNLTKEGNIYDNSDNYRNIISTEFNLTPEEFDLIKGVLPHIAKRESSNGKGFDYNLRNSFINLVGTTIAEGAFNIAKKLKRGETSPLSLGPYQMKYDIFVNDPTYKGAFKKYKISKSDIIKDNDKATLAALIKLAGDYNVLKTQKLINKNGKKIPYEDALKFIWHYGPQPNWQKVEVLNDRYVRDKLF